MNHIKPNTMKTIVKIILAGMAVLVTPGFISAQTINWGSLGKEDKHVLNLNAGWDYGVAFGTGYGYHFDIRSLNMPLVLDIGYSFPSGRDILEDFKVKIGGKISLYEIRNIHFIASVYGVFRRYENDFVRMVNFGSDLSAIIGYYRPHWFVAGEFGFDKAVVSNFRHSSAYKEIYPGVKDGWYVPPMGGNYHFGLQAGYSFRQHDFYLSFGRVTSQDWKTTPMVPYYAQVGYNFRIRTSGHKPSNATQVP
jgi:hypothetical protein